MLQTGFYTFDISVEYFVCVEEIDSFQELLRVGPDMHLCKCLREQNAP